MEVSVCERQRESSDGVEGVLLLRGMRFLATHISFLIKSTLITSPSYQLIVRLGAKRKQG